MSFDSIDELVGRDHLTKTIQRLSCSGPKNDPRVSKQSTVKMVIILKRVSGLELNVIKKFYNVYDIAKVSCVRCKIPVMQQ